LRSRISRSVNQPAEMLRPRSSSVSEVALQPSAGELEQLRRGVQIPICLQDERRFCETARISCALPIFERPSIPAAMPLGATQ
jgi:hypothetical protein